MPLQPPRYCATPGCPTLTHAGHCPEHQEAARSRNQERNNLYSSKRWRMLRRQVLTAQPWCAVLGCTELARDVDHITPLAQGGSPWDKTNLQGLCKPHHSQKTRTE